MVKIMMHGSSLKCIAQVTSGLGQSCIQGRLDFFSQAKPDREVQSKCPPHEPSEPGE